MAPHSPGVRVRILAPARLTARAIDDGLQRFRGPLGLRVRATAAGHPALAELAVTFPALLVALALPAPHQREMRATARALVVAGQPARAAAAMLQVPYWLRRLPPDAFFDRLPCLPMANEFACRITNMLPEPRHAARWLETVRIAALCGDDMFTLWAARNVLELSPARFCNRHGRRFAHATPLPALALFAFYSRAPGTIGHRLVARRWNPEIAPQTALAATTAWLDRIEAEIYLGDAPVADVWQQPGRWRDIDVVPLDTVAAIAEEAAIMQHCVLSYAAGVAQGYSRLWSLRRAGVRLATMEVRGLGNDIRRPLIAQLQGPRNGDVGEDVWRAAYGWIAAQQRLEFSPITSEIPDPHRWRRIWLPYWRARGFPEWLPVTPDARSFWLLARGL